MRNHDEKYRDIARSVLPSTARRSVRAEKARIDRKARHSVRIELHVLGHCVDDPIWDADVVGADVRRDVCELVEVRRDADKVGPLVRWAGRIVEREPRLRGGTKVDRTRYFASLLPEGSSASTPCPTSGRCSTRTAGRPPPGAAASTTHPTRPAMRALPGHVLSGRA